ncbi:putative Cytokinin dehydrogenase 6 [Cocos nucifera]|nr:putative Cytokinin dehydrogenase 6 [Cocos nucifera]
MPSLLLSLQLKALLLHTFVLFLSSSFGAHPLPTNQSSSHYANLTTDYGRIIYNYPSEALQPKGPQDISQLLKSISSSPTRNNVTVAPRGAGHSTYGQAQALDGTVMDMRSLTPYIQIGEIQLVASENSTVYVDAGGGVLWIEVLNETLRHGLTPRSWTDYLYLTVGGTLSNAGISGQAYKYGPQIANVMELDVVTGKGDIVTCSEKENSELFYGALGGLGQFGIITRARIVLEPAPQRVKWARIPYDDFNQFAADEEQLIKLGDVNYLEGFISFKDNNSSDVYYTLEFAIYYNNEGDAQKTLDQVLSQSNSSRSMANITDVSYFDFLNRNQKIIEVATAEPTTNKTMAMVDATSRKTKTPMSRPRAEAIGNAESMRMEVRELVGGREGGMGAKQYLPYYKDQNAWKLHFGEKWGRFEELKSRFDPLNILAPGQRIFQRRPLES